MTKVLIINTGGTFNKVYNPINGLLEIDTQGHALRSITSKWNCEIEIKDIIGKDSLDMSNHDRLELLATISQSNFHHIIIVHGTDTMDITAEYLNEGDLEKCIILTGAMVPYSIDPVEATANLCSAYGYMNAIDDEGIYIAMHSVIDRYDKVKKDRSKGKFTL
ncbi:asparaginase domain-containing protein [Sulfurovum sp.]|uniref:asparaginase domain-containing protein n=1 Tax=Sulfurovum sp. TaxID=1969726 RepID=UPI002867D717|nr:asparaginase domain-containing protein [Sulfurovum sp.]